MIGIGELDYLKDRMKHDIVLFAYEKADGTRREAYGTLNQDIINEQMAKKKANPAKSHRGGGWSDSVFPYFDCEKIAWRCFTKANFLEINDDYGI